MFQVLSFKCQVGHWSSNYHPYPFLLLMVVTGQVGLFQVLSGVIKGDASKAPAPLFPLIIIDVSIIIIDVSKIIINVIS